MLLMYNCVLLKMSTWYSKHVEESNNIWRINSIQCITLVVLYGQLFLMFGILLVAMKPHEIQEKLGLTRIRDRNWYVQPSCATTGDGLYEGLTWLTSNHKLWTRQQWLATCRTHAVTRHTFVVIQCILVASLWSEVAVWLCPAWLQVCWGVGNVLQPL